MIKRFINRPLLVKGIRLLFKNSGQLFLNRKSILITILIRTSKGFKTEFLSNGESEFEYM